MTETGEQFVLDRSKEPWFWSHYDVAASAVMSLAPQRCFAAGRRIVDFGCGDGVTALGIASRAPARVIGVDLYRTFAHLKDCSERNLGRPALPPNLSFVQNELGRPLPLPDAYADLIYSWSVFEHLSDAAGILEEFARISRPGGAVFIQIEPLFYSPFGSHLQRLVDEPWAHLLYGEDEYLARAASASNHIALDEQDTLYRTHEFDELKRHLIEEYRALNRTTVEELSQLVGRSGFTIRETRLFEVEGLQPPAELLQRYSRDQLMTNQMIVIAERAGSPPTRG